MIVITKAQGRVDIFKQRSMAASPRYHIRTQKELASQTMSTKLVVGYIPEHFSTPMFLAEAQGFYDKRGLEVEFKPFPSGSGHLIQSLGDGSINVAVGLTEAFVRAVAAGADDYRIVGTYVESPLCWAVSTGYDRAELTSVDQLEGGKCGVSRMGSGSDVMSRVLQKQYQWTQPFTYEICSTFANLRDAVNHGSVDFFMWEHFTSKKYYDNNEIKKIGEIYTPWPSWIIAAHTDLLSSSKSQVLEFTRAVNEGIAYFNAHLNEGISYITSHFDYSEEDAKAWTKTVEFSQNAGRINPGVIDKTISVLMSAIDLPADCQDREYIVKLE